jgi:diguanylate cyclase (GGDEF)-like protein
MSSASSSDGAMRQAALDLLVKTHLDNAARRDEARQELLQDFYTQAMAMVALVAGLAILALGMRGQYRRVARLAADLRTLNQTLEARVEERTRAIEDKQQLLQSVLEANPSAVVVLRASDAQVLYANAPLLRALGLKCVPAEPLPLSRLFVDPVRAQEIGEELRLLRRVDGWEAEVAGPHGFPAVVHAREVAVAGEPAHLIWLHDHSDWKALEEELRLRATTDGLTGLMNRRYFMDIAEQALDTCRRYGHPCSVLMLDADHFKAINDRYGHPVGDEVLVALARVLRKMLRRSDLIARYGGEEFVMLLPHTSAAAALATAQRLRERCGQLVLSRSEGTVRVTVSIGVATWVAGESLARMLSRADAALYVAKARGRNQCATEADVTPVTSPDLLTDTAV